MGAPVQRGDAVADLAKITPGTGAPLSRPATDVTRRGATGPGRSGCRRPGSASVRSGRGRGSIPHVHAPVTDLTAVMGSLGSWRRARAHAAGVVAVAVVLVLGLLLPRS